MIRGAIKAVLPGTYHVIGELSNLSRGGAGHVYFTLKDQTSEIRCVLWKSSLPRVKFDLEDGLEVIATGEVDVFEQRGQYQLYVRSIEPRGSGALDLAFRQLRDRLQREGLFDPARKRKLPGFPRRIAVVTSPTGAAIRDILTTIRRRCSACEVFLFGVRVQGEAAAAEIADAIRRINLESARLGGIDVMIVGRGGGSIEDLWAFNEEVVARAIFQSAIPVISAVGHEVDFTISDFVADVRAATPTAAAELVVPVLAELLGGLDEAQRRLLRAVRQTLDQARSRLAMVEQYDWFRDPLVRIRHRQQQIDEAQSRLDLARTRYLRTRHATLHDLEVRLIRLRPEALLARRRELLSKGEHRLQWAMRTRLTGLQQLVAELRAQLDSASPARQIQRWRVLLDQLRRRLNPATARTLDRREQSLIALEKRIAASSHQNVLNRGFSITRRTRDGKILSRATEAAPGESIDTQTADGRIRSVVSDDPETSTS